MKPIPGNIVFDTLKDEEMIIMACNLRMMPGITKGIMRAAKDMDSAIIFELAKSESDLQGGYTGLTPAEYSKRLNETADEVGLDCWVLHADHLTIKKGTPEEVEEVKQLIKAQIDAGYTSFAIDASHIFNFDGATVKEELADNIKVTTELAKYIQDNKKDGFGLEVEVGEIGRKDNEGLILTKPEEAVVFIQSLNANGINPDVIAIANGTSHGNTYDGAGNLIEQVSIDIDQTIAVAKALEDNNLPVRIAQHGITGTPRNLIDEKFPKGSIIKGNIATFWQNMFWNVLEKEEPELYKQVWDWTMDNCREKAPDKTDNEIFGKFSKLAITVFKDKIDSIKPETIVILEELSFEEAKKWIDCFDSRGSAIKVREAMK